MLGCVASVVFRDGVGPRLSGVSNVAGVLSGK